MVADNETGRVLIRMRDAGKRITRGGDVRRRVVETADGTQVGTIRALYIDPVTQLVRYLEVVSPGLPGFSRTKTLVPVEIVIEVTDRVVRIDDNPASPNRIGYSPNLGDWTSRYDSFGPLP